MREEEGGREGWEEPREGGRRKGGREGWEEAREGKIGGRNESFAGDILYSSLKKVPLLLQLWFMVKKPLIPVVYKLDTTITNDIYGDTKN